MDIDNKKTNYTLKVFSISSIIVTILIVFLTVIGYDMFEYFKSFQTYHNNFHTTTLYNKFELIISNNLINLLTLPFPNVTAPYITAILMVLIVALTSVVMYAYLNTKLLKQIIKSNNIAMIISIIYAVVGFIFKDFYEVVLFLPLSLLIIEKFILEGKRFIVTLIVFLYSILTYKSLTYIFIIPIIYFIVRLFGDKSKKINTTKTKLKIIALFLIEVVLGVLLSGCFIYPEFNMSDRSILETIPTIEDKAGTEIMLVDFLDGFSCIYTADEEELLSINLPYNTDVLVTINDKVVELLDFNSSSFKVITNVGLNEIDVKYQPIGFMFGVKLSAIGFIFFVFYIYATLRVVKIIEYNTNPQKRKIGNLIDLKDMTQQELNKVAMDENFGKDE